MKYKEKIQLGKKIAEELMNEKPLEQIKQELKEQGLYNYDINNVVASARNIIGEQLKPQIREVVLANGDLNSIEALTKLDPATREKMIKQVVQAISIEQKNKVNEMLKKGVPPVEIFRAVRTDFYPEQNIHQQIQAFQEVKKHNSSGGRMLNIIGGAALILIGGGISWASMQNGGGRLFYGLIIVGIVMLFKGFLTMPNPD